MNDVIKVIIAEIDIRKKDILGVFGVLALLVIWHMTEFLIKIDFHIIYIVSFTSGSIGFEMQFFKEKKNRFSSLPISRIKIFLIESFRMSSLVILLNIIYVILLGLFDFSNNEYLTQNNVINYTAAYFAVSQFIIMLRHSSNIQYNIFEKIVVRVIYTGYVIALVLLTHYMVDNYMPDVNYISFIGINFIVLGIFISLILPANYLIFKNRGDHLK